VPKGRDELHGPAPTDFCQPEESTTTCMCSVRNSYNASLRDHVGSSSDPKLNVRNNKAITSTGHMLSDVTHCISL
jgi:hypothetical protein